MTPCCSGVSRGTLYGDGGPQRSSHPQRCKPPRYSTRNRKGTSTKDKTKYATLPAFSNQRWTYNWGHPLQGATVTTPASVDSHVALVRRSYYPRCHPSTRLNLPGVIGRDADLGRTPAAATCSMGGRRSVGSSPPLSSSSPSGLATGGNSCSCCCFSASAAVSSFAASMAAL